MMINIFDSSEFMPRFLCLRQNFDLSLLYSIPNIGTWIIYSFGFSIIWYIMRKKSAYNKLNYLPTLFLLMSIFFFFCGGSHLWNAVAFIWPGYYFFAVWEWCQFFVALFAFVYITMIIKKYVP